MASFVLPHHNVSATAIASTCLQMIGLAVHAMVQEAQALHVVETRTAFRTSALMEFALVCLTVETV